MRAQGAGRATREPADLDAGHRRCDVDGCRELVWITLAPNDTSERRWRVTHGSLGEAVRDYDTETLLVTTGYAPWAREVHMWQHAYEGKVHP